MKVIGPQHVDQEGIVGLDAFVKDNVYVTADTFTFVLIFVIFPLIIVVRQSSIVVIMNEKEEVFIVFDKGSKILVSIVTVKIAPKSAAIGELKVKVQGIGLWIIQIG